METQENIYLNVKTVPALEPITMMPHTAYSVYRHSGDTLLYASGWTLQDAIDLFTQLYKCNREDIRLIRPFRPQ